MKIQQCGRDSFCSSQAARVGLFQGVLRAASQRGIHKGGHQRQHQPSIHPSGPPPARRAVQQGAACRAARRWLAAVKGKEESVNGVLIPGHCLILACPLPLCLPALAAQCPGRELDVERGGVALARVCRLLAAQPPVDLQQQAGQAGMMAGISSSVWRMEEWLD